MKFALGFLAGLGAAWAALAIWQYLPEFPEVDDQPLAAAPTIDPSWQEKRERALREGGWIR